MLQLRMDESFTSPGAINARRAFGRRRRCAAIIGQSSEIFGMHVPNDPSDVVVGLELALGHREEGRKTEGRETSADDILAAMFVPDFASRGLHVH